MSSCPWRLLLLAPIRSRTRYSGSSLTGASSFDSAPTGRYPFSQSTGLARKLRKQAALPVRSTSVGTPSRRATRTRASRCASATRHATSSLAPGASSRAARRSRNGASQEVLTARMCSMVAATVSGGGTWACSESSPPSPRRVVTSAPRPACRTERAELPAAGACR
uniref:Predicted protein n=1 Tax=Hordeum vulgare subsp. vulgare TaxID=112509 RepID=F2D538_HORVV|nr:predicted protein [Hordeum vulgare subsp. vulgare]